MINNKQINDYERRKTQLLYEIDMIGRQADEKTKEAVSLLIQIAPEAERQQEISSSTARSILIVIFIAMVLILLAFGSAWGLVIGIVGGIILYYNPRRKVNIQSQMFVNQIESLDNQKG